MTEAGFGMESKTGMFGQKTTLVQDGKSPSGRPEVSVATNSERDEKVKLM